MKVLKILWPSAVKTPFHFNRKTLIFPPLWKHHRLIRFWRGSILYWLQKRFSAFFLHNSLVCTCYHLCCIFISSLSMSTLRVIRKVIASLTLDMKLVHKSGTSANLSFNHCHSMNCLCCPFGESVTRQCILFPDLWVCLYSCLLANDSI